MGIRIHKILGFGLDDVVTDGDDNIIDPRLNFENEPWYKSIDVHDFYEWWVQNEENEHDKFYAELYRKELEAGEIPFLNGCTRFCFHEYEGGMSNVLIFIAPYVSHEWYRYDDVIDYYEADGMEPTLKELHHPIFPWESYWDVSTIPPTKLKYDAHSDFVSFFNTENPRVKKLMAARLKEEHGIDNWNVFPMIPPEVVALVKYLKVFKEEKNIYLMKPMIYTYWS